MGEAPRVFISYSHDSAAHKQWVAELAAKLRHNGVDAILDQWDVGPGDDVPRFMEEGLRDSDRVLAICTDGYNRKADAGEGGVGYEKMIVTAELVSDLGTNKFIPVLRNPSPGARTPTFLGTRFYVDLSDGADVDGQFGLLLKELHRVPIIEKPPLGKSPYAVSPSGEEVPAGTTPQGQIPDISTVPYEVSEVYRTAVDIARHGDLIGWRQIVKVVRSPVQRVLAEWRERYTRIFGETQPDDPDRLFAAVDEAVAAIAPLFALALVGVESGRAEFRDQRALLDDLLNVSGWDYSGPVELAALPSALGYVYQGFHGSMCLSTGQIDLAMQLADAPVRMHESELKPLWQHRHLMGWPGSLGGNCRHAWNYLAQSADRWDWVRVAFGSDQDFRIALVAYFIALNIHELAALIADGQANQLERDRSVILDVPICFYSESRDVKKRAFSLLVRKPETVPILWGSLGVKRDDMEQVWPDWVRLCSIWVQEASESPFEDRELPHGDLFRVV